MINEKITVAAFVEKYTKCSSTNLRQEMIKDIVSTKYAPLVQKVAISKAVITKGMQTQDGLYQRNSAVLYLNYIVGMLSLYCQPLKLDAETNHSDYDLLKQHGILELIMDEIGEDVNEYTTIYNMETEDLFANQLSTEKFIASQVTRISTIVGGLCNTGLIAMSDTLSKVDEKSIDKFFKKLKGLGIKLNKQIEH